MAELAYFNGEFIPIGDAKISIEDRGFQFADSVYEVVAFYGNTPLLLTEHLQRLANSCRGINLDVDLAGLGIESLIYEGVRRAGFSETMVYVQVTRGVAPRNHAHPAGMTPTLVMTFKPLPQPSPEKRQTGLRLMSMPDFRWGKCHIKSTALLPNVMAKNEAIAKGFDDVLFVGPENDLREASASNFFLIRDGHLCSRSQDNTILPGITRQWILRCASDIQLPVRECVCTTADLATADEAFISSTTINVLPVVSVDSLTIKDGKPGPVTQKLSQHMEHVIREMHNHE